MKKAVKMRNNPFTKPARTSALTYPYEKLSLDLHLEMTEAASPANSAVQSKNMWKESEIRPRLETRHHHFYHKRKTSLTITGFKAHCRFKVPR